MSYHPWTHIVIHHSATVDGDTYSWKAIEDYHVKTLGWSDIGYHFGIEKVNNVYIPLLGRALHKSGAHCKQQEMNHRSIGLCFVGNYDTITPTDEMLTLAATRIIIPLLHQYDIPITNIHPHYKYADYKSCPGNLFPLEQLRNIVKEHYDAP